MNKKAITLVGVGILSVLTLTGCRVDPGETYNKTNLTSSVEFRYQHSSGDMLDCLKFSDKITCWISTDQTTKGN